MRFEVTPDGRPVSRTVGDARLRRRLRHHRTRAEPRHPRASSTAATSWCASTRSTLGDTDLLAKPWVPEESSVAAALSNRFFRNYEPPAVLVVNLVDGLQVALLPGRQPRSPCASTRAAPSVPVLAAGEDAPQALDLGGDDRTTDVIGVARLAAAARQRRAARRHPHVRRRLRPDGPRGRGAGRRRRRHPAGDARPGRRGDRLDVAHPRERARVAGRALRRRPVDGVRPHRAGVRARRAARPRRRGRPAPARLPPRRGVAARARHLDGHRPPGRARRARQPDRARARRRSWPAAGSRSPCCSTACRCSTCRWPGSRSTPRRSLWPLVVPAVLAAAAVVLVGGRARAVRASTTRPSLLREEEGR